MHSRSNGCTLTDREERPIASIMTTATETTDLGTHAAPTSPNARLLGDNPQTINIDPDQFIVTEAHNHSRSIIGRYADAEFRDLVESIRRSGITNPVLFTFDDKGQPVLRVGFRRVEAAKRLVSEGLSVIVPALQIDPSASDNTLLLLRANQEENSLRKGLTALDRAFVVESYSALGLKPGAIAKEMRVSGATVTKLKALMASPEDVQRAVHEGRMDLDAAYELSKKPAEVQAVATKVLKEEEEEEAKSPEPEGKTKKGKAKVKKSKLTTKAVRRAKVKEGKLTTAKGPVVKVDPMVAVGKRGLALGEALVKDKSLPPVIRKLGKALCGYLQSQKGAVKLSALCKQITALVVPVKAKAKVKAAKAKVKGKRK